MFLHFLTSQTESNSVSVSFYNFLLFMCMGSASCNIVLWNNLQVIKYESVIHEFDPYFNYRVTQVCLLLI